ncbi:MAG TPA: ATP-dependent Clp protease ATP-binding subunit ClpC, partial [bacterium]|nr:ATP-dependent Clp protease ATP-binding subunit ClpC [bacterium]
LDVKEKILNEVKKTIKPELLNRLDEIIVFHPLEDEHLLKIVDLEIEKVAQRLQEQGFTILLTSEARMFLKNKGTDPQFGARPLKRAISRYLEDPLSEEILRENILQGSHIIVKLVGDRFIFSATEGEKRVTTTSDKTSISSD